MAGCAVLAVVAATAANEDDFSAIIDRAVDKAAALHKGFADLDRDFAALDHEQSQLLRAIDAQRMFLLARRWFATDGPDVQAAFGDAQPPQPFVRGDLDAIRDDLEAGEREVEQKQQQADLLTGALEKMRSRFEQHRAHFITSLQLRDAIETNRQAMLYLPAWRCTAIAYQAPGSAAVVAITAAQCIPSTGSTQHVGAFRRFGGDDPTRSTTCTLGYSTTATGGTPAAGIAVLLCDWTADANVTRVALQRRLEAAAPPTPVAIVGGAGWDEEMGGGHAVPVIGAYHASSWTTESPGLLLGRNADKLQLVTGQVVLASDCHASGYLFSPIPSPMLGGAAVLDNSSRVLGVAVASSAEHGLYAGLDEADDWIRRHVPTSYAAAQRMYANGEGERNVPGLVAVDGGAAYGGVPA